MEKLCDDNDIRVVTSYLVVLLVGHTRSSSRTDYGGTPRHITNGVTADGRFKVVDKKYLAVRPFV